MTDSKQLQSNLARVALGDRAAFASVYQATSAHLFSVALRILNRRDVAEDVLQEAFVSVWHHAGSYQAASGQPMTWLISIVRNKALDVVRSASVRHEVARPVTTDGDEIDIADERPNPLQLLTQATDALAIRGCMEALDASHRQCLALAYYHGMSHSEIATHVRAPLGSVKAWVRRGLERLKTCMENG
ncbi:MAG: sigma-70 family RNA polymerase sigma factor [Burkholderiaceae bacterium]|nr:sigma-70 family RNA polymerase sigma factor [Burkholderiaceae bacterium]